MTCPRLSPQCWWSTLWSPRTHLCWIFFLTAFGPKYVWAEIETGACGVAQNPFYSCLGTFWERMVSTFLMYKKKTEKSIYDRTLPGRWRWCSCSDSHGEAQSLASHLCQMSFFKNPYIEGFPRCHWTCRPGGWVEPVDQLQGADHQVGTLLGTLSW